MAQSLICSSGSKIWALQSHPISCCLKICLSFGFKSVLGAQSFFHWIFSYSRTVLLRGKFCLCVTLCPGLVVLAGKDRAPRHAMLKFKCASSFCRVLGTHSLWLVS